MTTQLFRREGNRTYRTAHILIIRGLLIVVNLLVVGVVLGFPCLLGAENGLNVDRLVAAIYHAEGGAKAKVPFGILSVPCHGYEDCRRICRNTVVNTHRRWVTAGRPGEYLRFLARRYAPIGAANDPHGYNRHWDTNVKQMYRRLR